MLTRFSFIACLYVAISGCYSAQTDIADDREPSSGDHTDITDESPTSASLSAPPTDAETALQDKLDVIIALAEQFKSSYFANDHEAVVDLMHPELVAASGGRENLIGLLRDEEVKNKDAGMSVDSFEIARPNTIHVGSKFEVAFLPTVMDVTGHNVKLRSESFQIAFARLGTDKWHLIDGTRMTPSQFRSMFSGLPSSLELPTVKKSVQ